MSTLRMTASARTPDRRGMTIVELLVAMTIFGVVISVALSFMAQQNTAFQMSLERMSALRNARYAVTTLAQDLETLGTNVPGNQPSLFYADDDVVVFSSDYATNVAGDPFAVFHDAGAPSGEVQAPGSALTVPTTSVTVADTVYEDGAGVRSPAEILSFFFEPDSTTDRQDDFILYRQVNGEPSEVVARHLLRDGSTPFFGFQRQVDDVRLEDVEDSDLPVHHTESIHLSPADTAEAALADSIRTVRVTLVATNGLAGEHERSVRIERNIALPNAGQQRLSTCGSAPIFGDTLEAMPTTLAGGEAAVDLSWGQAVDENGGEADVVRYVLWRRETGSADWGVPFVALPAGTPSYAYTDATVDSGGVYEFAVAAQDCTPTLSTPISSGWIGIP